MKAPVNDYLEYVLRLTSLVTFLTISFFPVGIMWHLGIEEYDKGNHHDFY